MIKTFSTPVDASNYVAGFGLCPGVELLNINYAPGTDRGYIVQLLNEAGDPASPVLGIPEDSPAEIAAAGHCRAYIASR